MTALASSVTLALSHLFFAFVAGWLKAQEGSRVGHNVGRGARLGSKFVHGDDLRHPLAPLLLALGQARLELGGGPLRLRAGSLTQPVGAHHDPLRVARQHQQILVVGRRARGLRVERVNVLGG